MKKEFNLSEKKFFILNEPMFDLKDVKEFIERLKEKNQLGKCDSVKEYEKFIDKLAGDELLK